MPRHAARSRLVSAPLALCAILGAAGSAWGQHAPARLAPAAQTGAIDPTIADVRTLSDTTATASERQRIARRLIAACETAQGRETINSLLAEAPAENSGCAVVLSALGALPTPPPALFGVVSNLTATVPEDRLPVVLQALGSFRTRDSARVLVRFAGKPYSEVTNSSAFSALARLCGSDALGNDRAAWESWLASCERLTEAQWQKSLADALASRADTLSEQRRAAGARLVESLRRLHLATVQQERSALLVSLLLDELPEVRNLGFELAGRELSASRRLDSAVDQAALKLLTHPSAQARENAAVLVNQLGPADAGTPILAALAAETNPRPAAALITASLRWPSPALAHEVLRWLESGTPAAGAASDAALALHRAGLLWDQASVDRVLHALRLLQVAQLTPSGCVLLADIGEDADRAALASLLEGESAALRVATGEALAGYPEFLAALLRAAAREPQLFDSAVRAVVMAGPDAANFRAVARLPTDSPETRRRSLLMVAGSLPAPELLAAARETTDDAPLREALLSSLASVDRILSERADPAKARAISDGLIFLAETRLQLDRPDAAITALDTLNDLDGSSELARARALRARAMLALNRVDDALALGVEAETWLDALESLVGKPFARAIAADIRAHFGDDLSGRQADRLARLEAALPTDEQITEVELVGPPPADR